MKTQTSTSTSLYNLSDAISALYSAWGDIQNRMETERIAFVEKQERGEIDKKSKFDVSPYLLEEQALITEILADRQEDTKEKLEGYIDVIQERGLFEKGRRGEAARLEALARTDARLVKLLKDRIVWFFLTHELAKMETERYQLRIHENPGNIPLVYPEPDNPTNGLPLKFIKLSTVVFFDDVPPNDLRIAIEAAGGMIDVESTPKQEELRAYLAEREALLDKKQGAIEEASVIAGNAGMNNTPAEELDPEIDRITAEIAACEERLKELPALTVTLGEKGYHLRVK